MEKQSAWVRERTSAPFVINLFTSPQPGEVQDQGAALAAVAQFYSELGLGTPQAVQPPYAPNLEAQLDAIERIRPRAVTSHLADFPVERVRKFIRKRNDNLPAHLRFDDLLYTFALVLAAVERDLGPLAQRAASFAHHAKFELRIAA